MVVSLVLEKEAHRKTLDFDTGVKGLMKAAGAIRGAMKDGWQLVDVSGSPSQIVAYIRNEIDSYAKDPKNYQVPIKGTFKTVGAVTGASAKQIARAGRKAVTARILAPFRKSKDPCGHCGRLKHVQAQPEGAKYLFLCNFCVKDLDREARQKGGEKHDGEKHVDN